MEVMRETETDVRGGLYSSEASRNEENDGGGEAATAAVEPLADTASLPRRMRATNVRLKTVAGVT